jgi:hypothetical protein
VKGVATEVFLLLLLLSGLLIVEVHVVGPLAPPVSRNQILFVPKISFGRFNLKTTLCLHQ